MKTLLLLLPLLVLTGNRKILAETKNELLTIQGKVVAQGSKAAVYSAYIHITAGEEEAITDKDGNFKIKTWQKLPVTCTVEHKDFVKQKIIVNENNATKLVITLQEK